MLGYILFVLIGMVLGLIGGGGSILGVPVLVYVLGYSPVAGTGYSLFIVGISSLIGSFTYFKKGLINLKATLIFAIPSVLTIFMVRKYLIPAIPDQLANINGFVLTKGLLIMLVFALLMIIASWSMIKVNNEEAESSGENSAQYRLQAIPLLLIAVTIGFLSGFVGAGGGFLIIPALVFFVKLPMKLAIGTSLTIISINSLIGFTGTVGEMEVNWKFLMSVSALAIAGIIIGAYLSNFVSAKNLKPAFGWFTLLVGITVIVKEIFLK